MPESHSIILVFNFQIKLDDDECSNDDESGNEESSGKHQRELSFLGSPGPYSPGQAREPRSCVLNQRQKKKPLSRLLEQLLRNLEKRDQNQFFAWPVTDNYAPNYSTIIKRPMDFSTIKQKIDDNEYKSLNCFNVSFKSYIQSNLVIAIRAIANSQL